MSSVAATFTLLVFGCCLVSVYGRAHRQFTRLEDPCRVEEENVTGSIGTIADISADDSLRLAYENVQHTAQHGADLVTRLKRVYVSIRLAIRPWTFPLNIGSNMLHSDSFMLRFSTRIFYRRVPGFVTDCPCGFDGFTTCPCMLVHVLEI